MPSLSLSRMSSWDQAVSKLNFSANVTIGTMSMTLKLLNKISAFFSQFVLYACFMRETSEGKKYYCLRSGFMSGRREAVLKMPESQYFI